MANPSGLIFLEKIEIKPNGFASCFFSNHEKLYFSKDKFLELALYESQEFAPDDWDTLKDLSEFDQAFHKALSLLSASAQSEKILKQKLYKKGFKAPQIEKVCEKCRDFGYLNDENFARLWLTDRLQFKNEGRTRFISALIQKGIHPGLAKRVVYEEISDEKELELASALCEALCKNVSDPALLLKKMVNRGFSYGVAKETITGLKLSGELPDEYD